MKRIAYALVAAVMVLAACWDDRNDVHEEVHRIAYEGFECMIKGDVDGWLALVADYDSLPEAYRTQLRDAMLQHLDKEKKAHGGLVSVEVTGDNIIDSITAEAYVQLLYADSVSERIHLPVVRRNGVWYIR